MVCTAAALFAISLGATNLPANPQSKPVGKITGIQHVVEIRRSVKPYRSAAVDEPVLVGDIVRTGKKSKVDIRFGKRVLIRLDQNSKLKVTSRSEVRLMEGSALCPSKTPPHVWGNEPVIVTVPAPATFGIYP